MDDLRPILERFIHPMLPTPTGVEPMLDKLRPFSAILFDIYGTLLISAAGEIGSQHGLGQREAALSDLIKRHGIHASPVSLHGALNAAIRAAHHKARARGIDCPEIDIVAIWCDVIGTDDIASMRAFALAYELIVNPIYPMPGAARLLWAARDAKRILGIVSNAQFYTPLILNWFFGSTGQETGFDERCCFFSYRDGQAKPSAVMFAKAGKVLTKLGVPASEVLYVGNDMLNDMLPASAAGFATALFAGDRRSLRMRNGDERVGDLTPDLIVTDLRQLIPAIVNPEP